MLALLYTTIAIHNICFHWYEGPNNESLCGTGTGKRGKDDLKSYTLCLLILFGSTSYVNIFRMSLKYLYSSYKIWEGSDEIMQKTLQNQQKTH